jgi:hypothetical protein
LQQHFSLPLLADANELLEFTAVTCFLPTLSLADISRFLTVRHVLRSKVSNVQKKFGQLLDFLKNQSRPSGYREDFASMLSPA